MKRNVLIIEDNKVCMDALVEITKKCDSVGAIFCAENKEKAYTYAMEETIDLFLVDIILDSSEQQDISGMRFVEKVREMDKYEFTPVIFITNLIDEEMNAFHNLHCYGYIEKPFDPAKLQKLISSALNFPLQNNKTNGFFYYRKDGIIYSIEVEQIICAETSFRKLIIYTTSDEIEIAYKTCSSLYKELPREHFIQCSRNAIVNRKYIEFIDKTNRYIKMRNGKSLEIGRIIGKNFFEELGYDS